MDFNSDTVLPKYVSAGLWITTDDQVVGSIKSNYIDQKIILNYIHNVKAALLKTKSDGLHELLQNVGNSIKRVGKGEKSLNASSPDPLSNIEYIELTSFVSDIILRQFTDHPPQKPDIIIFPPHDWDTQIARPQQLSIQFAQLGHRVFYIQASFCHNKHPVIKKIHENLFLVKLPKGNQKISLDSTLSKSQAVFIRLSILKLTAAFNILTAIIKVDLPFWRLLVVKMKEEFGWKLVYDCSDEQDEPSQGNELDILDEKRLVEKSDLVLFSSDLVKQQHASENTNAFMLPVATESEFFPQAAKTDAVLTSPDEFALVNTWKKLAVTLEAELINLFPKISIIVITYNKLEYTRMCLDSIFKNTEYPRYDLIIVDNASTDGTVELIEGYKNHHKNIVLIRNGSNLGFAAANNIGVRTSNSDFLVLLNNDTIVTPGWLHRLLFHLNKNTSTGMVGPVTNAIGNEAKVEIDYTELTDVNYFAAKRAEKYAGITFEIQVLALYCAMISRSLYNRFGGLDERFHVGMFEDDDLALNIRRAGFTLLCAEDVFIHHFHGISFNQFENQDLQRIFHENRIKFEQKWGTIWVPHQNRPK
jgi:GT2 family glycosyltransferase